MAKTDSWVDRRAAELVRDAREAVGPAWNMLGNDLRRALLAERILVAVCARDQPTIEVSRIEALQAAVYELAEVAL